MRGSYLPLLFSLFFLIAFTVPFAYLIYGSVWFKIGTQPLTWTIFTNVIISARTAGLLVNTFEFAIGSALLGVFLGVVYTWIVVRTDVPGKSYLKFLPILGLSIPFLVRGFSLIYLFSPQIGIANLMFERLFGLQTPIFNIYSIWGLIFAGATGSVPFIYLTLKPALDSMDPSLEESSRVAGNGILKTLWKVTVPVILPAILSSFLIILIFNVENFDYPFLLGAPAQIKTLATEVYYWSFEILPPNYGRAFSMSIIQVLITFITVTLYIWVTRKAYKFVVVTGKAARPSVHALRRFKYVAYLICLAILTLIFFLPFAAVVLMSLTTFITVSQGNLYLSFTVQNYTNALSLPMFYQSFLNSILLGIAAAGIVSLIAVFLSYGALKTKTRGARLMEYIGTIPLAVPGIVYGLALFWTFLLLPGINILYGTIWPLVIALVFVRLPQSVRMLSGNVVQISDEMEEASRVCGGSWTTTMRRVVLPLLRGGLTSSFTYTFINSLRELGSVIILVTPQSMVLTVLLLNLYSQHPMALNTIAAAAVILCIVILVPLVVIEISQRAIAKRRSRSSVSSQKVLEQNHVY